MACVPLSVEVSVTVDRSKTTMAYLAFPALAQCRGSSSAVSTSEAKTLPGNAYFSHACIFIDLLLQTFENLGVNHPTCVGSHRSWKYRDV